jgi:hypothetical protein
MPNDYGLIVWSHVVGCKQDLNYYKLIDWLVACQILIIVG